MGLLTLLKYLPDLIELVMLIKRNIDEEQADRKVQEDIKSIIEAFHENNPDKLNHLFKRVSVPTEEAAPVRSEV
jgi:hypothetical protein